MPSFQQVRLQISKDPKFISALFKFQNQQTSYKAFSLEKMAISAEGHILVPLFSTEKPRQGVPDGLALILKSSDGWQIATVYSSPEPRVL